MSARDVIARHLADFWPVSTGDERQADAILSALTAAGLVVVPREPTAEIIRAAAQLDWSAQTDPAWQEFYAVMIAAAQELQP